MKVLVACEYSARVRDAFRAIGHDAFSCDFEPCEGDPRFHIQGDVLKELHWGWDLLVAHPPCTFLTNTANWCLYNKNKSLSRERWKGLYDGVTFFKQLWAAPIPRICIENPIMSPYAKAMIGADQAQTIQPWQFGHPESKATCLWLKALPPYVLRRYYANQPAGTGRIRPPAGKTNSGRAQTAGKFAAGRIRALRTRWRGSGAVNFNLNNTIYDSNTI